MRGPRPAAAHVRQIPDHLHSNVVPIAFLFHASPSIQAFPLTMIRIAACPKRFCATNKCRQRKTLSFLASPTSAVLHSSFPYTSLYSRPRQAKSSAPLPFSGFFPSTPLSSFHSNAFQAHPFPTTSHRKAASSVAEEVQEEPPSSSPFPFLPPSPHHSSLPPSSLPTYEHPDVAAWEENVRQEDIALLSGPRPREWWTGREGGRKGGRKGGREEEREARMNEGRKR
jgi:hypothetical protein